MKLYGKGITNLEGHNFNSRCGSSIIKNLGVEYLIAKNEGDYISKAISLSNNLDKLMKIRDFVYNKAIESPLFIEKFTNNFEKKLETIISTEKQNNFNN